MRKSARKHGQRRESSKVTRSLENLSRPGRGETRPRQRSDVINGKVEKKYLVKNLIFIVYRQKPLCRDINT